MFAERVNCIQPAVTIELSARIREMRKNGVDIISLNIGEPDFAPPAEAVEGVMEALRSGLSKYGAVPGIADLREEICKKLKEENGLAYTPDEICVSTGAKQAVFDTLMAVAGPGDEVIIPTPCWVSYNAMISMTGATPVPVPLKFENGFQPDPEEIERAITEKTRAIILCTPNNPTGAVYSEECLTGMAEIAVKHDIWILSDEIYERILFPGNRHFSIASVSKEAFEHVVTINGFSKAFAIPGWRVGYTAAPAGLAKQIAKIQGHVTSATSSLGQMGALYALRGAEQSVRAMSEEYTRRMELVDEKLKKIPGLRFVKPQGTFYFFVDVSAYFGKRYGESTISDAGDLAKFLLDVAHIAVVQGEAFGYGGFIRISFSNSRENISEALDRMKDALALLQ